MWLINLTISLFSIIKTRALECVSIINRKCMPRPKILDVNEGIGEALFYPYNVLVNKCIGSCNTLDNPMAKLCVPNIIKRINMKCRCDCNEDFAGIINCSKGYMRNPSTCECQYDMWCKPGQYLDHENCVCKNKLVGTIIGECTNVINETIMNNKDNINNDNTITYIFIGLFSILYLELFVFAYLLILNGLKVKNYLKKVY